MMNNIGLIISGNLTGFSRFYASPTSDAYKEANFDFDYRNFVTFLKNEEKAYVISFSRNVISVSLINRTLDSFRRPGILVISVLMHRNEKVESINDSQNEKALYQLLNEIKDKFCEKNFINGMLNQNAAVLMQDYYTPILAKYVLKRDSCQRSVNANIDETLPNKQIGYICSSEEYVPLYLSSLCRRSYEGFHHVIFAENANQTIDEDPVEVILYRVHIINNDRLGIPPVRLSDNIYDLQPEYGERDIPKNFTYQQILNGESPEIKGTIKGDILELNYRFLKEQKTVLFKFMEGEKEIPFEKINLVIVNKDDTQINIPTNPYTFEGREIYDGLKTLKSGNDNYKFNTNIDLQRISDHAVINVPVVHVTCYPIDFSSYSKPKEITFYNTKTGKSLYFPNVTQYFSELIPGNIEDWEITIDSIYYEQVRIQLPPSGCIKFELKPKKTNSIPPKTNIEKYITTKVSPSTAGTIKRKDNNNSIVLSGDNIPKQRKDNKKKKLLKFAGGIAILLMIIIGCWQGYKHIIEKNTKQNDSTVVFKKTFVLCIKDTYNKNKHDSLNAIMWKDLLIIHIKYLTKKIETSTVSSKTLKYKVEISGNNSKDSDSVNIEVKFHNIVVGRLKKSFKTLKKNEDLNLDVANSQLKLYETLLEKGEISQELRKKYEIDINNTKNKQYIEKLMSLLSYIHVKEQTKTANRSLIRSDLDRLDLDWDGSNLTCGKVTLNKFNKDEQTRVDNYIETLKSIQKGESLTCNSFLSKEQQKFVTSYMQIAYNLKRCKLTSDQRKKLQKVTSLHFAEVALNLK